MNMILTSCNICRKRVRFGSIENTLGKTLSEHGFPYELADFETLNFRNYKCPSCSSNDRDRLFMLYFENYEKNKPLKLIDFAPSKVLQEYLKKQQNINYRSADLMMKDVDDKVDITNMSNYKNSSFDFFVCSHILEHVDDQRALSELFRILKPGGRGILMTPIIKIKGAFDEDMNVTNKKERIRRFAQDDHIRLYEKGVFLKRVKDAGFNIRQIKSDNFGRLKFKRHGIDNKSVLYIVEKRI